MDEPVPWAVAVAVGRPGARTRRQLQSPTYPPSDWWALRDPARDGTPSDERLTEYGTGPEPRRGRLIGKSMERVSAPPYEKRCRRPRVEALRLDTTPQYPAPATFRLRHSQERDVVDDVSRTSVSRPHPNGCRETPALPGDTCFDPASQGRMELATSATPMCAGTDPGSVIR